jgi:hypothetical protein
MEQISETVREAVGLFDNMEHLQDAVRELESTAFPRQDISILGHNPGAIVAEVAEDNPNVGREAPVRVEEQIIGTGALVGAAAYVGGVAAALAAGAVAIPAPLLAVAIGIGGGATAGGILAKVLGNHYDKAVHDQIEKGGLLLWIRTPDEGREKIACNIMNAHGARHVHIHEIST